jgi:excinuclease ABC subunit A
MKKIIITKVTKNNLHNFSVKIPLGQLVAIVGPSGSGKSTLVHEVLYNNSIKKQWKIENLPARIEILEQKVVLPPNAHQSLGEFNLAKLKKKLAAIEREDLLIVDEPCAGFCRRERLLILKMLQAKVKQGYSIIAVEHNPEIIAGADYIIELGPGSGRYGGKLIFEGTIKEFQKAKTITAEFVFHQQQKSTGPMSAVKKKSLTISKINANNFKNFSFTFPLNSLVCLTGASGSGKSTLLDVAYRALFKGKNAWKIRLKSVTVKGKENVRRSFIVPQAPIGDHPTSTLATYTGVWDNIREIFAAEMSAKKIRLTKADFIISKKILDDEIDFPPKVLSVYFQEKNIKEVMAMTIDEALEIFRSDSLIVRKLKFLQEVGLGYLVLGQRATSLSGGEAQRVRVANILAKKLGDRALYIFDTPSRGLHPKDIPVLVEVFRKIAAKNNTILIADNREELFEACDDRINL